VSGITLRLLLGVVLSLADYTFAVRKRRQRQGDYNREVLLAIERILDHQSGKTTISEFGDSQTTDSKTADSKTTDAKTIDSKTMTDSITLVREHLINKKIIRADVNPFKRLSMALRNISGVEIINNLSLPLLFVLCVVLELAYDFLIGIHIASPEESGLLSLLIADFYQIPLLFFGFILGRWIRDLWMFAENTGETQKIEETISLCVHNTALLQTLLNADADNSDDLWDYQIKLSRNGAKILRQINAVAKQMSDAAIETAEELASYQKNRSEQQAQEQEQRSQRFDDLTKGR